MDSIDRLFKKWIAGKIGRDEFLAKLDQEKAHAREQLRRWWRSPPAFEAVWNDRGGFNEAECEHRVQDAYSVEYASIVRRHLQPIIFQKVKDVPEMRVFFKEMKPILLSDLYRRAEAAETIEDVYFLLGDELTHWLVLHLARYLKPVPRGKATS